MMPQGVEAHTSLQLVLRHSLWTRANKLKELGDDMREGGASTFTSWSRKGSSEKMVTKHLEQHLINQSEVLVWQD